VDAQRREMFKVGTHAWRREEGDELPITGGVHRGQVSAQQRGLPGGKQAERRLGKLNDLGGVPAALLPRGLTFTD
jgi:hypothetical protein